MNKFIKIFFIFILIFCTSKSYAQQSFIYEELPDASEINAVKKNIIKHYDYTNPVRIPIVLRIDDTYTTDGTTKPGEEFSFTVKKDVYYKGKLLVKKGEKTKAVLTHYIDRGMNGIPSILIIEGFSFKNIEQEKLDDWYMKRGFDNTLFVLPLKWVLTPLYPLGSFANFIIGCEARVSPNDDIYIYYYPEWIVE